VSVRGALGVGDLRRLEHACAPALERLPAPLDLDVGGLQAVDEPARRFMQCLLLRGASLIGPAASYWSDIIRPALER
jgi:hypothetical protein